MNKGKVGAPFGYSHTYIQFLAFLKIGFKILLQLSYKLGFSLSQPRAPRDSGGNYSAATG
jgi:hypothetical protein